MSFTSNHTASPSTSPTSRMSATQPMAIAMSRQNSSASTSSQSNDYYSSPYHLISSSTVHPVPYSSSTLRKSSFGSASPSAYISDEDLFGDDDAYLTEPPPPPRTAEQWLAKPLLPPVTAVGMSGSKGRRRSSAGKERRSSKTPSKSSG